MELQLALLVFGLIVIGVVALTEYEKFRFRRRRLAPNELAEPASDEPPSVITHLRQHSASDIEPLQPLEAQERVLKADIRIEAATTAGKVLDESLNDYQQAALMPLDLSLGLNDPEADLATGGIRQNMPDERIDYIVNLPCRGPVTRELALGVYRQNEYRLDKPRQIYGLGYRTGQWSNLEHDPENAVYRSFSVGIQMVDSRGPIGESELNTFVQLALKLADTLNCPTQFSMTLEEGQEKARELDEFCETNDVLASVNILANGPTGFNGRAIDKVARHFDMRFGAMNIYHRHSDQPLGARQMFSLANLYQPGEFDPAKLDRFRTQGLTLFMNVPCAYQPVHVFDRMIETAKGLCQMLDGRLEDQDRRPLHAAGIQVIRTQIERISTEMTAKGIVPGSSTAMRLFG